MPLYSAQVEMFKFVWIHIPIRSTKAVKHTQDTNVTENEGVVLRLCRRCPLFTRLAQSSSLAVSRMDTNPA